MSLLSRAKDLVLPLAIVSSLLVIIVPLPGALIDVLLAANIAMAVIVVMTTVFVRTPLEFSVFPSLLLATTLSRLVLNVATTRLILTQAPRDGQMAAGGVIKSFGEFVAGDHVVVGLVIFSIIVIIQFVVITKGATRISEVAARFSLDGMPGRQMAIDADFSAGLIDHHEARRRRDEITRQADFYGAMDGASKFIRGDAIAGMAITVINLVGGLVIGVLDAGMSLSQAGSLFSKLTIGDGLVSQVPAFLISLAAGLLITRSTQPVNLPEQFLGQLFARPKALAVTAGFLAVLTLTDLPAVPLLTLGGGCAGLAVLLTGQNRRRRDAARANANPDRQSTQSERPVEDFLAVDPMELEIGIGLVRAVDPKRGGDLLSKIARLRQRIAGELGIVLPKVRIRDNMRLAEHAYRIKIAGNAVAEGHADPNRLLAVDSGLSSATIDGIPAEVPAYSQPTVWISPSDRDRAEMLGFSVVEPTSVLAEHLDQVVRQHADELLTRDAVKHLVDELKKTSPAAVEELIPDVLKLAEVQQILKLLLRERIPVRQLGIILETLGDFGGPDVDPILLVEHVRQRLARTICSLWCDEKGRLHVVTLEPSLEDRVAAGIKQTEHKLSVCVPSSLADKLCERIAVEVQKLRATAHPEVVLVGPRVRAGLRQLTQQRLPNLNVISYSEITQDTIVESAGTVSETEVP